MSLRVVPDPRPQLGVAALLSWLAAGVFAFVVWLAVLKRRWELSR